MQIILDTANITDTDLAVLLTLAEQVSKEAKATLTEQAVREAIDEEVNDGPDHGVDIQPEPEPEKPRRKRRTKAEMEAARAAEVSADDEPEAAPADLPAPEEAQAADEEPSTVIERFRAEAVERASALVAQGQRQRVKEALQAVGALKVSMLPDDKLAEFLGHLKD